jgi:hypothetical protein
MDHDSLGTVSKVDTWELAITSISDRRMFVISLATCPISMPAVNSTSKENAQGADKLIDQSPEAWTALLVISVVDDEASEA